jgi:hypothetical protein
MPEFKKSHCPAQSRRRAPRAINTQPWVKDSEDLAKAKRRLGKFLDAELEELTCFEAIELLATLHADMAERYEELANQPIDEIPEIDVLPLVR